MQYSYCGNPFDIGHNPICGELGLTGNYRPLLKILNKEGRKDGIKMKNQYRVRVSDEKYELLLTTMILKKSMNSNVLEG